VTVPGRGHQMPHTYALTEIDPLIEMPVSPYAARHGHFSPFPSAGGAPPSAGGAPRSAGGGAPSGAASDAGLSQGGGAPGGGGGGLGDGESTHATLGSALGSGPSSGSLASAPDPARGGGAPAAAAAALAAAGSARPSRAGGRETSGGGCVSVAGTDDAYAALAYQGSFFNYFSIGGDAQAAHGFHSLREKRPGCAGTRFANMFWYSWFSCSSGACLSARGGAAGVAGRNFALRVARGAAPRLHWPARPCRGPVQPGAARRPSPHPPHPQPPSRAPRAVPGWFCNTIPSISRFSHVEILRNGEWAPLDVPAAVKALVVVNLQSYGGGRNIWGPRMKPDKARARGFVTPSVDDGMIEVGGGGGRGGAGRAWGGRGGGGGGRGGPGVRGVRGGGGAGQAWDEGRAAPLSCTRDGCASGFDRRPPPPPPPPPPPSLAPLHPIPTSSWALPTAGRRRR
jgi:hypothetical protein